MAVSMHAAPKLKKNEVNLGTSIMAVSFDGGVIVAADSRTSTGSYVANRVSDKLTPLADRIMCCRSGSAADTQAVADMVAAMLEMHSVQLGEPPSVATAAKVSASSCYKNKDNLLAGLIIGGWDKYKGGQVFSIPLGGSCIPQPFAIGGSGSTYIYAYCDANFQTGMTRQQCIDFVKSALSHAMARDGSSGGTIRMAIIDEAGIERTFTPYNALPFKMENAKA